MGESAMSNDCVNARVGHSDAHPVSAWFKHQLRLLKISITAFAVKVFDLRIRDDLLRVLWPADVSGELTLGANSRSRCDPVRVWQLSSES